MHFIHITEVLMAFGTRVTYNGLSSWKPLFSRATQF